MLGARRFSNATRARGAIILSFASSVSAIATLPSPFNSGKYRALCQCYLLHSAIPPTQWIRDTCDTERTFPFQIPAEISMSIPRGCNKTGIAEINFLHARVPIIQDLLDLRVPWALQRWRHWRLQIRVFETNISMGYSCEQLLGISEVLEVGQPLGLLSEQCLVAPHFAGGVLAYGLSE
jgi:hypothetical protein